MPSTVNCLVAGTVIMLAVAFILIPNPLASIWVILTIISIEVGVLGFMYVWDINLDVISMIWSVYFPYF
jgi:patched domain-containing protein